MKEIAALKALLQRDKFIQYREIFYGLKDLPNAYKQVLKTIGDYYEEFANVESMGVDELQSYFESHNPTVKDAQLLDKMFNDLRESEFPNSELLNKILQTFVTKYYCGAIAQAALPGAEGKSDTTIEEVEKLIERYREDIAGLVSGATEDSAVCLTPFRDIVREQTEGGFRWHLQVLEKNFGNIKRRTLGHIFARSNVGKSSFAINLAVMVALQLAKAESDEVVLYMNNEESIDIIRLRAICCLTMSNEDMLKNSESMDKAEAIWDRREMDKYLKLIGNVNHIATVEKHMSMHEPAMAIIDQGPKVQIFNRDVTDVVRLQLLYNQYREIAKRYNTALVTVGQADRNAENQQNLTLNHLDGSKVGIPGELDWAIGIGAVDLESGVKTRYLNVAKNKGRMGRGTCSFEEDICRYFDMGDGSQKRREKKHGA